MSEVRVNPNEPETRSHGDQDGPSPDPVKSTSSEASSSDLQGLLPDGPQTSADDSPSPSAETSGLLSLPWEMVTHIASHLPAQCVISVLPKVCHALGNVGKDNSAWQLRAHRLTGSRASFPVGPREDFDWPSACLEMEQLITCWTDQGHLVVRQSQEVDWERGPQQRARHDGEPVAEIQDGREDGREVEGVGVVAQEVAYGVDEGMEVAMEGEDGEMQPIVGVDQLAGLREALEERLEDNAAALMDEERNHRMVFDANEGQDGALNRQEHLANPRNLGNGRQVEMEQHQLQRSPSPPPALECITLPLDHIAQVNTVLLLGGEGTVCATGSRDRDVKLWDLQAASGGKLLYTLGGRGELNTHQGWVWCLASRGPLLASGAFDRVVKLWDLHAGGAERGQLRAENAVLCLSYQSDVLLAGTFDKKVNIYDTRAAEPLVKSLRLHGGSVLCLAADERYIISGGQDSTVAVYDRRAGKRLKNIRLKHYLRSMSYSGYEIWAGDRRGMLHSFSMQSGTFKPLSQFDVGHTDMVTEIHRSNGSLYSCSSDCTVKVHIPCAPPRTLCTLHYQRAVCGMSVKAGILAVATSAIGVEIWRPRK